LHIIKLLRIDIYQLVLNCAQSAQIYDISGDKMQLILDFPTIGEPHYAQAAPADLIRNNGQLKFYELAENKTPKSNQR
jgi:nitrous-oxide reductase